MLVHTSGWKHVRNILNRDRGAKNARCTLHACVANGALTSCLNLRSKHSHKSKSITSAMNDEPKSTEQTKDACLPGAVYAVLSPCTMWHPSSVRTDVRSVCTMWIFTHSYLGDLASPPMLQPSASYALHQASTLLAPPTMEVQENTRGNVNQGYSLSCTFRNEQQCAEGARLRRWIERQGAAPCELVPMVQANRTDLDFGSLAPRGR